MADTSLSLQTLNLGSAEDVHEVFRRLGYNVFPPQAFEGDELDSLELDETDRASVQRAYVIARQDNHTVYLYEVDDLRQARLRGLAWNALQRGTAMLAVARDYREVVFVDPRVSGTPNKSNVRVNKLHVMSNDPTRHDLDTLNAIHAYRRSGQQIYDAQATAFNITTVTQKFYAEYRRHYEHARAIIKQYNTGIREFQNSDETAKLHAFTQRLLGRLMFLYFLQRKEWLGGKTKFLTQQYADVMRKYAGDDGDSETFYYYREVLEPLFFQTLNTKRPEDFTIWKGIRIPYLNGGLFDESRDPAGPILLPDSLFDLHSNEGLLAFFNRYNFTIAEDTPLEQDVAVDPEMLGKVFENMLEERDRGQSGSFYTPRAIVSYMCQEALAGYLEESTPTLITREQARALFAPDSDSVLTVEQAHSINAALDTLTVLDPAVGSGSFLIGMMNEIIRLRKKCHDTLNLPFTVADWKEAIIRDTLYGVDIKPEAIEIAQLRLWLALVVDQTYEQARPLPNLDYKLMAGNSLIETIDGEPVLTDSAKAMMGGTVTPQQPGLGLFETDHERYRLDELRQQFFRANPAERKAIRTDITEQERRIVTTSLREKAAIQQTIINDMGKRASMMQGKLKPADEKKLSAAIAKLTHLTRLQEEMHKVGATLPFFLYHLHFSEVFEKKGGFDVVVANPPYVRGDMIGDQKGELKASYAAVFAGSADLYVYFFARSYDLLKRNGQLAFITSNKYLRAGYGKGLRTFLSANVQLNALIDFGDLPVFDVAAYPCIVMAEKSAPTPDFRAVAITTTDALENLHAALENGVRLNQADLGESEWQIADANVQRVLAKIKAAGVPLGEYVKGKIYYGIKTGLNEAFVIDEAKRAELIAQDPKSAELIKPWLRGRDIKRWRVQSAGLYGIFLPRGTNIADYPAIKNHLAEYKTQLMPGVEGGRKPGTYKWYETQDPIAYYPEFEKPKIVWGNLTINAQFALDELKHYISAPANIIVPKVDDEKSLLGIMNSSVSSFVLNKISAERQNGYYEYKPVYVSHLPIPNPPAPLREAIGRVAEQCLAAAASNPSALSALEAELNALVYQAYGLDEDDIAVIEVSIGGKQMSIKALPEDNSEE